MSKNDLNINNLLSKLEKQASNIDINGIYPEEIVREFANFNNKLFIFKLFFDIFNLYRIS